jgi:hypothetical protein
MTTTSSDDLFIDGGYVTASSTARVDLVNPATEEVFAQVVDADEADVDRAVASAQRALPGWRETPAEERAARLAAVADGIQARAEEMDRLITQENGAPLAWAGFVGSGGWPQPTSARRCGSRPPVGRSSATTRWASSPPSCRGTPRRC